MYKGNTITEKDKIISDIVKRYCYSENVSQSELARQIGADRSLINTCLNGHRAFSYNLIAKLSKVIKELKDYEY